MGIELEDRPGSIKEVTDVIRAHGRRLAGSLTGHEWAPPGYRHVYLRARDVQDDQALQEDLRAKGKILYFFHDTVE